MARTTGSGCKMKVYGTRGSWYFKPSGMTLKQMRRAGDTYSDWYRTKRSAEKAARSAERQCRGRR